MLQFVNEELVITDPEAFEEYTTSKIKHFNPLILTEKISNYISLLQQKQNTYKKSINILRYLYWTGKSTTIEEFEKELDVIFAQKAS